MDPYHKYEIILAIIIYSTILCFLVWGVVSIVFGAEKPLNQAPSVHRLFLEANIPPCYTESLIDRIIRCESDGDPSVCNQEYGCKAGMGLFQLIPSTVKYCEEKLGREIDPFNEVDNRACAMWLLENEGTRHWSQSEHCWSLAKE